jgi:hypothetical protein
MAAGSCYARGVIEARSSDEIFEGDTDDPYRLAVRAYVWGFALVLGTRIRQGLTNPRDPFAPRSPATAGAPLNNLGHQRRLSDPTFGIGVAPNVDTLYSLAWLDLAEEPFVLDTPDFGDRYHTFQMGYGDTATELSLGTRSHGGRLPPVFIGGPNHRDPAPAGMFYVACPTRYFLLAGRILVQPDATDYEKVYDLQSRIKLRPLGRYLAGEDGTNPVPEQRLFDEGAESVAPDLVPLNELGNVLRDWVVLPQEQTLVDSLAVIGLTREHGFRAETLGEAARAPVARGLADAAELVDRKTRDLGKNANGWTFNYLGPRFGNDYLLRAAVAKDQIYVTVPEEALYPLAKSDGEGLPLTGEHAYRIRFAVDDLPPVDAFWSLTMYTRDCGPLVPNPIDRYAIGDRTAGLVRETDDSLAVQIQNGEPSPSSIVNWLPAPKSEFHLMMRLYLPRANALDGSWVPPVIERVAGA